MREYGKIKCSFWNNAKVRGLSERARYLLMYLYSCPHGNSIGCFVLPGGYIMEDLNWDSDAVLKHVSELVSKGFIERDETTRVTRLLAWWEHNHIENINVAKNALKIFATLPKCDLINKAFQELKQSGNKFVNALLNELKNEFPNQEPEQEPERQPEPEKDSSCSLADGCLEKFEKFWEIYPRQRRGNQEKAVKAFEKALTRSTWEEIYAGTRRYVASDEVARGYAKGAAAWLNDDRWTNDYRPPGSKNTASSKRSGFTAAALEELERDADKAGYAGCGDNP